MKNENKCFFSISLENGITITGSNPDEVRKFIMDCYTAIADSIPHTIKDGFNNYAEEQRELYRQLLNASNTIKDNYKH